MKRAMKNDGLKINKEYTKMRVRGSSEGEPVKNGSPPCAVYDSGVGVNSVLCTQCGLWYQNDALGFQQRILVQITEVFVCPRCSRGPAPIPDTPLTIADEEVGLVDHFCYLGNMLNCEGGAEKTLIIRTAAA